MTTITWLHLSDLHIRGTETAVDRGYFDSMLLDIEGLCKEGLSPDAVFFTGDTAFSGQAEQYTLATKQFDEILKACGLLGQRDKFFIVPGNHDVNRGVATPAHRACIEDLLSSEEYKKINDFLGPSMDWDRRWIFGKFENFASFSWEFSQIKFDYDNYYFVRSIERDGHTVVVIGLNSAWASFRDNEQGRLLLGETQVCDALEEAKNRWPDACLRIALVHHPLYWLAEKDTHRVLQYLPGQCDFLVRGHLHCSSFSVQSTPDSYLHVFAAGASLKAEYHAYNLVQVDLDKRKVTATVRLQHPDISPNWGADTLTYRNAKNGRIVLPLGQSE